MSAVEDVEKAAREFRALVIKTQHEMMLKALRDIANYTVVSTVQPVSIARGVLDNLGFPWRKHRP